MRRVALLSLPRQDLFRPPAAIPILAAACEEYGINYEFFDFNLWLHEKLPHGIWREIDNNWIKFDSQFDQSSTWAKKFRQELDCFLKTVFEYQPDMVAISVFTRWSAHCAWEMIQRMQDFDHRQHCKILIGGTGISTKLPWISDQPMCVELKLRGAIDHWLDGEGEINFRHALQNQWEAPGIDNFDAHQIDNLDAFGYPSYRKVDAGRYKYIGRPSLMLNGSRGCVRRCTYCDVAKYWPKFRYKSGRNLAREIYHTWQETGVENYEFSDSLINGNLREFRAMNHELISLHQLHPEFQINYKGQFIVREPQSFTEQDYEDMQTAGCDYLYVGVETFSERVRHDMDKKFSNRALDFHLKMCGLYGIPNLFLMIVGYPTETSEDHEANLQGLAQYQKYSQAGVIEMITWGFTTSILPDTPLYQQQQMLQIQKEFDGLDHTWNWVSAQNPALGVRERVRRWTELTQTSYDLGYNITAIDAVVGKLSQMLDLAQTRPKHIPIRQYA